MTTNREHQSTTATNRVEIEELSALVAPIADGVTVAYTTEIKITKLTVVNGIITELETEE